MTHNRFYTVVYQAGPRSNMLIKEGDYGLREFFASSVEVAIEYFQSSPLHSRDKLICVINSPAYQVSMFNNNKKES